MKLKDKKIKINKKVKLEIFLLILSDSVERLLGAYTNRQGLWYWDYFYENENFYKNKKEKAKIYSQIYYLKKFGYVDNNGFTIKGLIKIIKIRAKKKRKDYKWDDKWRVVIFDIPEKKRGKRNYFRKMLSDLGFQKLQNSVWASPYDNFKEIQEIIKYHNIAQFVVLMIVDKISKDLFLKEKFGFK
ncbi:MAG: CRISPR-associated endonuclease Cas2 [Patescibacteria group bacterium]|nr:CRISPR-associated endonuclease Cas2 [Patescibacteria group bacterium]